MPWWFWIRWNYFVVWDLTESHGGLGSGGFTLWIYFVVWDQVELLGGLGSDGITVWFGIRWNYLAV